jgi:hypothetical protein
MIDIKQDRRTPKESCVLRYRLKKLCYLSKANLSFSKLRDKVTVSDSGIPIFLDLLSPKIEIRPELYPQNRTSVLRYVTSEPRLLVLAFVDFEVKN